ncbi:MBOAT family O-acyltransferase [Qipengyuania sp. CAU 1752]
MSLLTPALLLFLLPLTLLAFYAVGRRSGETGALFVLLLASFVVAQSQGWWFFGLFMASLVVNGGLVMRLAQGQSRRWPLIIGILANLGALGLFKYAKLLKLVPGGGEWALVIGALIPVTISFLTFQRIAALLDSRANAEHLQGRRGLLRFVVFASAFPNLLIGPIAYLDEVLPQFRRKDFGRVRAINFAVGLTLISIGLFKKAFIADGIGATFVDPVWSLIGKGFDVSAFDAAGAIGGYMLQLYFDFSGYSDMAIGVARLFGIILPINFYSPFRATGIADFYRRWHVTLTRIIARFLFTPLSLHGARFAAHRRWPRMPAKVVSVWLPLVLNFAVIGLWHGATETFLLFGVIHGVWFAAETEMQSSRFWKRRRQTYPAWLREWGGRAILLPMLALTFAMFRAPKLSQLGDLLGDLVVIRNHHWFATQPDWPDYGLVILAMGTVAFLPNSQELLRRYRPGIITYRVASYTPGLLRWHWRPRASWALATILLALAGLYALPRAASFSYEVF